MFEGLRNFVDGVSTSEETKKSAKKKVKKFHHHEKTITERLEDDVLNQKSDSFDKFYSVVAIIMAVIIIGCLLFTVSFLPSFGDPSNPANNIVSEKYIVDGVKDTHAINLVAGMILDYRAFDTLGESTVLFIAASAVIILLFANKTKKEHDAEEKEEKKYENKNDPILRHGALLIVPAILVYGIYVVLNGHISPGGGFSGGAIMGAAIILYNLAFGDKSTSEFFSFKIYKRIIISALMFYAISKSYSFYTGANQIHSIIPKGVPGNILSSGLILPLNICVGIVVCCTMFGFYSLFDREEI